VKERVQYRMKWVLALLILVMNMQPLAADACDVAASGQAAHHAQVEHETHDRCCDPETMPNDEACEHASACGYCSAISPMLVQRFKTASAPTLTFDRDLAAGQLAPSHSAPPFRPPIS